MQAHASKQELGRFLKRMMMRMRKMLLLRARMGVDDGWAVVGTSNQDDDA